MKNFRIIWVTVVAVASFVIFIMLTDVNASSNAILTQKNNKIGLFNQTEI